MMFFIFGWGTQTTKEYGPVDIYHCNHCNNDKPWVVMSRTSWFTLFFIPIIPYGSDNFLICPICKYGVSLHGKKFEQAKTLAKCNAKLLANEVTGGYIKHIKNIMALKKPESHVKADLILNAGMKSTAPISTSVAGVKAGLNLYARLETYFSVSVIARAVAVVLLFWGLARHPSDYYTVIRWVVCGVVAYSTFVAFSLKKNTWVWGLGFIALFFNPLIPVRLNKDTWEIIYVVTAFTLIISIFFAREGLTETSSGNKE